MNILINLKIKYAKMKNMKFKKKLYTSLPLTIGIKIEIFCFHHILKLKIIHGNV